VHPFPSLLDGAVVGVVATVAGGSTTDAVRLGVSMTALQFAIGAANDVVDAPTDLGRVDKPIASGAVSRQAAIAAVAGFALLGVVLVASAPVMIGLALLVLGIGFAYDLWAKGTALSWLPYAVGVPLLPVYGWLGATGTLPDLFIVLVPVAAIAGAALAIANALVDLERDQDAGVGSIALTLGRGPAALLVLGLHAVVVSVAVATLDGWGVPSGWALIANGTAMLPLAGAVFGFAAAFRGGPSLRERAWEVQAVGAGLLATAWIAAATAATEATPL
jgi:4-hydroxybenzoate polyprenyltransferase